jgi:hypothetical protein
MSDPQDSLIDRLLQQDVFVTTLGEVPPGSAGELRTYLLEVHRCCVRSIIASGDDVGSATAFVLSDRIDLDPVYEARSADFSAVARLDGQDSGKVAGPILLTTANLRLVFHSDAIETTVAGIVTRLRELGLGDRPTVIFVPAERTLTFYQSGADNKPQIKTDALLDPALDPSNIVGLVDYFHDNWTRFPDGFGSCWDNATDRIVHRNAERHVRDNLYVFLSMVVYKSRYVIREHQLPNGRVDIFVFGFAIGPTDDSHRVIELKVLRSRSIGWKGKKTRQYSEKANKRYVEQGLRQAARYRASTRALEAFLFCFDCRIANLDIDVVAAAGTSSVTYRRYFMESTASEA